MESAIIVRLRNYKDKNLILKNAHKLKGQNTNIGISEDFFGDVHNNNKNERDCPAC